jgi:phage terminase small subunit
MPAGRKPKPEPAPSVVALERYRAGGDEGGEVGKAEGAAYEFVTPPSRLTTVPGAKHAVQAWEFLQEHLGERKRLLESVDLFKLEMLCTQIGLYWYCNERMNEPEHPNQLEPRGRYYKSHTRNGTQHKLRPEASDQREALRAINTLASDFGMDPVSRLRLLNLGDPNDPEFDF